MITLWLLFSLFWYFQPPSKNKYTTFFKQANKPNATKKATPYYINQKKPQWIKLRIIVLMAQLPDSGCRQIAAYFNRIHACQNITVGKTYVAKVLKNHHYEILHQKRNIKNKPPYPVLKNKYWGIDLTFYSDEKANMHTILGICDASFSYGIDTR
jgi:hypothetical protein